jgi:ubiquitin carboxyl-terminal hydrolase L3
MVPQPTKAVILLFPLTTRREGLRKEEDEVRGKEGQHPIDPTLIYITQTVSPIRVSAYRLIPVSVFQIRNACGAIGLLHAITNVCPAPISDY